MIRRGAAAVLVGAVLAGCAAPAQSAPAQAAPPQPAPSCTGPDSVGCIDEAAAEAASQGGFAGVILIARDGEAIWQGAYGEDPVTGELIDVDTRFDIASSGKMFTAVAVAQLEQAGKLSFDDTVDEYVAELPSDVGRATIGQLLSHTSGLGLDAVTTGLAYEPGTYNYSNAGFNLLAQVVENVTDQTFADYLQENVFAAAEMDSTAHLVEMPRGSPSGKGGQKSTAEDMLRFANALLEHRLLDESATTFITSAKVTEDWGGYGYGFAIPGGQDGEPPSFGHIGGLAGVVSVVMMNPTLGYTTIVLCDHGFSNVYSALAAFHAAIGMPYPDL